MKIMRSSQPFNMAPRTPMRSYNDMLLEANPRETKMRRVIYNICAGVLTWILLAAFLIIPGTFTSLTESSLFQNADQANTAAFLKDILDSIAHVGLLWVAGTFYFIGVLGCLSLWRVWSGNYIWLSDRLFVPALLNSTAGLLSTVVNVYTTQEGAWSLIAKVTAGATGACIGVSGIAFLVYSWKLKTLAGSGRNEGSDRDLGSD